VRLKCNIIMPVCKGRPDGPCSNDQNDNSVKNSIADLFLCPDCMEYRFPLATSATSDNAGSSSNAAQAVLDDQQSSTIKSVIENELLCFIQQKSQVMTFDDLVCICSDFYTAHEIETARSVLEVA